MPILITLSILLMKECNNYTDTNLNITGATKGTVTHTAGLRLLSLLPQLELKILLNLQNVKDVAGNEVVTTDTETGRVGDINLTDQTYFGDDEITQQGDYLQ